MKFPTALRPAALGKFAITTLMVMLAIYAGQRLWTHYEIEPWTRDGRVKAYVVQIAPDVSGLVTAVAVHDNQDVKAGDLLFEIDRARFQLAYDQAQATVNSAQVAYDQALRDAKRNRSLGQLVAIEALEQSQTRLQQTQATLTQAQVQQRSAQLNLERSRILAATNGRITNLDLRAGAYVTAGHPVLALVDTDSFYVEGYFEETKLANIHEGDSVTITLMGDKRSIKGHVESIAVGIADRDRSTSANLLPNVNPTFNWVRLAQRIPVRIALDHIPAGLRLVAGQTATVAIDVNTDASAPSS